MKRCLSSLADMRSRGLGADSSHATDLNSKPAMRCIDYALTLRKAAFGARCQCCWEAREASDAFA